MQEIDVLLDTDTSLASQMVDLDIRNQLAHRELTSYNDKKTFLYVHPFTQALQYRQNQYDTLYEMKTTTPEQFMREIANTQQNIARIRSNIAKQKYKSDEELENWNANLKNAEIRLEIMKVIIMA